MGDLRNNINSVNRDDAETPSVKSTVRDCLSGNTLFGPMGDHLVKNLIRMSNVISKKIKIVVKNVLYGRDPFLSSRLVQKTSPSRRCVPNTPKGNFIAINASNVIKINCIVCFSGRNYVD